ncbi:MAG: rRNA maturation RNase YbeY [Dehalococcoidales bacterium]|nr:rRNA maturation RNase YbeY [Dehalococcoidales bacterium]
MDISILFDEGFEGVVSEDLLYDIASTALKHEGAENAEMSIFITGQEHILELNEQYLQADHDTDVLSFAMQENIDDDDMFFVAPDDGVRHLGEVIISYPQAEIQAKEHGHSTIHEVAILLTHGTLHLLGYDHDVEERKAIMWKHTDDIIAELGDKV